MHCESRRHAGSGICILHLREIDGKQGAWKNRSQITEAQLFWKGVAVAKRILIAESDGIVALDLRMMLEDLGFETPTIVTTGIEALQAAKENAPFLIITETKLQGDLDGIETVARINRKVSVPVIYLTAQSDRITLERAKKTNPVGYILKPFSATQLQIMVELALQGHEESFMAKNECEYQRVPGRPGSVLDDSTVVERS